MLRYADKVYGLSKLLHEVKDRRIRPRINTFAAVGSALVMALTQMGSLNALEQTKGNRFWRKWLDSSALPSADAMGMIFSVMDCGTIRGILKHLYSRLKRNKVLRPVYGTNTIALIIDGHESNASYLRCCDNCLKREIKTLTGSMTQYYHRHVMGVLLCKDFIFLLDLELQRPAEDEVSAAVRLLQRIFRDYPRAFDIVIADGLYARASFFKEVAEHGKDVIAVLKDDRRDLVQDALSIFTQEQPVVFQKNSLTKQCWDIEGFTSWVQLDREVRVVRSLETTTTRRQSTGKTEDHISDWLWVATVPKQRLNTEAFVDFAHCRWSIENNAFNELGTFWHADHVYKHNVVAIEAFWLITMLAYNLFHAFINLNLKQIIRHAHTKLYFTRLISAELFESEPNNRSP